MMKCTNSAPTTRSICKCVQQASVLYDAWPPTLFTVTNKTKANCFVVSRLIFICVNCLRLNSCFVLTAVHICIIQQNRKVCSPLHELERCLRCVKQLSPPGGSRGHVLHPAAASALVLPRGLSQAHPQHFDPPTPNANPHHVTLTLLESKLTRLFFNHTLKHLGCELVQTQD